MYAVLIKSPANLSPDELRQVLLGALGGSYDAESDTYGDSEDVKIPQAGQAPGTTSSGGAQICQLLYSGTQAELESALQDASLNQHTVVGFQTFANEYQGDDQDGNPIYAPTVTTAIENGTLQYLQKRYSDEAQTIEIPPDVSWFPVYQGQSAWAAS